MRPVPLRNGEGPAEMRRSDHEVQVNLDRSSFMLLWRWIDNREVNLTSEAEKTHPVYADLIHRTAESFRKANVFPCRYVTDEPAPRERQKPAKPVHHVEVPDDEPPPKKVRKVVKRSVKR